MSSIMFLVAAVAISLVGCAVFLLRHRKPTSLEYGIESFTREMAALSPERRAAAPRRRTDPAQGAPSFLARRRGR